MSAITAAIAAMRAKGMADSDILDIVAEMAAVSGEVSSKTSRQERNARYYQARKDRLNASEKRLTKTNSDVSDAIKTVSVPSLKDPLPNLVTVQVSPNPPPYSPPALVKPKRFPWPEDFRDVVWSAYPRKTEKKPGIIALEALCRADRVPFAEMIDAIQRMARSTEAKFCPALHRWIKNERWNDLLPSAGTMTFAQPPPPPAEQDALWRRRLTIWRETGDWNGHWGNHPETPGFQVLCPKTVLREFNLERPAA